MADLGLVEQLDTSAPPFKGPDGFKFTVDLPFPPSVNRLWRSGTIANASRGTKRKRVYLSPEYVHWKLNADTLCMVNKALRGARTIGTVFEAEILLDMECSHGSDLDNRAKAVLDWAQARDLILNDRLCRRLVLEWVTPSEAPHGCRLTLVELG